MSEEFSRRQYYRRKSKIVKMKRKIALARKRIRRFRMLLRVALIFGLLYFSYWVLNLEMWYLNPDDIMNLNPEVVKVEGCFITPEDKILDIIRTTEPPDEQIFKYSTRPLEENIAQLQPIKKAYVRRFFFPARIIVFVEERTPVFLIAPNDEAAPISAITKDGFYIDREYMPIPTKFKTTKILSYGVAGDDYENWDKKRVDEISRLVQAIETYSKQKVLYLDIRNPNDVYVKLEDILLRLGQFDETAMDRIKWLPTILPKTKMLDQKIKYLDLRWKDAKYIKLDLNKEVPKDTNSKKESKADNEPAQEEVKEETNKKEEQNETD